LRSDTPTSEQNIRQAIAACIDRSTLAELTSSTVAESYLHPFDPAFISLDLPSYNPQAAMELLSQMEIQPELTLKLAVRDSANRTVVEMLVANLIGCGFMAQPDYLSAKEFFAAWPEGLVLTGQYDLVLLSLNAANRGGCQWFVSANTPSEENPEGPNVSGWMDELFDKACEEAYATPSSDDRISLEGQAQSVFGEALPSLPLYWLPKYTVLDCRVADYKLDPLATELWNIEEISLGQNCGS
jgi:ABC-type transport system substrate-binding protein